MYWIKQDDYRAGGRWQCSVIQRERDRRYRERKRARATAPDDDREPRDLINVVLSDLRVVTIETTPEDLGAVLANIRS